ncbi:MAG: lipocalin family protein [Bacteroidota bacterium]
MKLFTLFGFILSIILFGCSSDDDNEDIIDYSTALIGRWEIVQILENDQPITITSCQPNTIEFQADGTVTFVEYTASPNCVAMSSGSDTYTIEANVIEIFYSDNGNTPNGFTEVFTILEIDEEALSLVGNENGTTLRIDYRKIN